MEIGDLTGLSKPLTKLIEVISQGIGAVTKPYLIKKTAEAKAYELKVIAESIDEHKDAMNSIQYSEDKFSLQSIEHTSLAEENRLINQRISKRLEYQENKKQQNIESITSKTIKYIENENEISDEKVNVAWTTRFFNYAQDVSEDEMQELWARILAGEVIRPGSYSLRTLELIRNLTKKEAETFTRVANLTIVSSSRPCIFRGKPVDDPLAKYGCTFEDRLLLSEVGLLQPENMISRNIPENNSEKPMLIYYESGNILIKQTIQPKSNKGNIPIYRFSIIGEELLGIIVINPNLEYLKEFGDHIRNSTTEMEYAFVLNKQNGQFNHTLPWTRLTNH